MEELGGVLLSARNEALIKADVEERKDHSQGPGTTHQENNLSLPNAGWGQMKDGMEELMVLARVSWEKILGTRFPDRIRILGKSHILVSCLAAMHSWNFPAPFNITKHNFLF